MKINLENMICLLANNDPLEVYDYFLKTDEEFRGFIEKNKDKSAEKILPNSLENIIRERMSHVS